jgi:undecaprenyl-diphosphatase
MFLSLLKIIVLGLIQGATELLPVSSSAHVVIAEKLMGIDPTSPEATFFLIMLHTGTMFAILAYFWRSWLQHYLATSDRLQPFLRQVVVATACTGVVGLGLKYLIEKLFLPGSGSSEIESLFGNLPLIAAGLAAVGVLILVAGCRRSDPAPDSPVTGRSSVWIGIIQGLCLPIRGFSRSGATISTALLAGAGRQPAEEFSFALGFVITPELIALELRRLVSLHHSDAVRHPLFHQIAPGLIGMVCSFFAGLLALRLLSRWLAEGHWRYFGFYCLAASAVVFTLAANGF